MSKIGEIVKFYDQVKQEISKVTWPSKSEVINSTLIVVAVVLIFSLVCLGLDYAISSFVRFLLKIGR